MMFPLLSLIIFIPLLVGVILLALPEERRGWIRGLALVGALLTLVFSLVAYFGYDVSAGGYQFQERMPWLPALGIGYHVGADGISLPLLLLGGLVAVSGVLVSWRVEDRPREFFAFLMFLVASVQGVFASLDLFQLFFFFELAVFPKYLMIVLWGSPKTRNYGGMKLTLYLFFGSVVSLVAALAVYFGSGLHTFDLIELQQAGLAKDFQYFWFPFLFIGFALLSGIFPLHSWAPDGHVAAPTAISMLLAGVEMKVGAFAALRIAIELLPEGARQWAWLILLLGTINVVYGALIALVQKDFKYVIGFSSVSHMGLVLMGFATLNADGLLGAGMQMFSHGVMTALFFAVVGMVYDRTHERDISRLGGLVQRMPWAAVGFIIGGLVSMGMPGFSGFVAEYPIFMGVWRVQPVAAVVAALGILITSGYILLVVRRVFFGELPAALEQSGGSGRKVGVQRIEDVSWMDKVVIGMLALIMIGLGWFPALMTPWVQSGVQAVLAVLGGGQ